MALAIMIMICFSFAAALWIGIEFMVKGWPTRVVDPSHYERRYAQGGLSGSSRTGISYKPGHWYKTEHYVDASYTFLFILAAVILAILTIFWVQKMGQAWFWGPAAVIIGSLAGFASYKIYDRVLYATDHYKILQKIGFMLLIVFCVSAVLLAAHALIHKQSVLLWESLIPSGVLIIFLLIRPVDLLIDFPAEMAARKQIYDAVGHNPRAIRNAEAMRRQFPGKPTSYRDLLKILYDLSKNK